MTNMPDEEPLSLIHISAEEITSYSPETVAEWLLQCHEQRRARLLAACASLRVIAQEQERSYRRLQTLLTNRTA